MTTLQAALRISAVDAASARLRSITGALGALQARSRASMVPIAGIVGRLAAFGGAYVGATSGISGTIGSAREMQAALTEIGIKSDMSSGQLEQLRQKMTKLAPATNQTTKELVGGVDAMVTMGLSVNDAVAAMPAIGKAATGTMSSVDDLSAATVSAIQNMGVASGDVGQMLDSMTSAGNAGAFEMRDMAKYFPQLTASAKSLGMEGVGGITDMAAALQIARRGAGDASTAANNLSNFLGKIMSPEVIKRFKKFGVDVTKELKKAHKQGISPIEHFIGLIDEKTKGGEADLLGQLFGDKQVLDFVRPMLADFKDYLRIRGDAERASGTVAEAYARRMQDANERLKALQIRISNAGTSIGIGLLEPLAKVADYFAMVFDTSDNRVSIFDRLKAAGEGFAGGLGFEGGAKKLQDLGDMIFGIAGPNGVAAGQELGKIAAKFRAFGEVIKSITDAVSGSPIAGFLTSLGGYGLTLAASSMGISLIAGSISRLAGALALLSGARAAVSLLRLLGKGGRWAANAAGIAGGAAEIADQATGKRKGGKGSGKPPRGKPKLGGTMGFMGAVVGLTGLMYALKDYEGGVWYPFGEPDADDAGKGPKRRGRWKNMKARDGDGLSDWDRDVHNAKRDGLPPPERVLHPSLMNDNLDRPAQSQTYAVPPDLATQMQSVTLQTRSTGVSEVKIVNPPQRPNVTIHAPITVNGVTNLEAIGRHLRNEINHAMSGVQADMGYAAGM